MKPSWRTQYLRYKAYLLNTVTQYNQRADTRVYLEILLSLATISVFAIFALRPTLITIAELIKDIESKKQTIALMDQKIDDLAKAETIYRSHRSEVVLLKSAVPTEALPEELVRQFEGLATRHPAEISSLEIENALILGEGSTKTSAANKNEELDILPEGTDAVTLSVSASGNYSLLANYIDTLEKLRRPVKIDALNFASNRRVGDTLTLTISSRVPFSKANKIAN